MSKKEVEMCNRRPRETASPTPIYIFYFFSWGGGVDQLGFFCWEVEDPKNGRGDPKNGEGVEMNLEIFFGGGFIIPVT